MINLHSLKYLYHDVRWGVWQKIVNESNHTVIDKVHELFENNGQIIFQLSDCVGIMEYGTQSDIH